MPVVETERTGTISGFYDTDTGSIIESGTNTDYDFAQRGAQVNFSLNEGVRFITIKTPSGKEIVKQVIKK